MSQFEVGKIYNTRSGHAVRIVERDARAVFGSDGRWRHDIKGAAGVLFWGSFEDPLNLVVPPPPEQPDIKDLTQTLMYRAYRLGFLNRPFDSPELLQLQDEIEAAIHQLQKD